MARVKVALPAQFLFSTTIPIRITDLNYGGHLGNDRVLTLVHEARVQFLASTGYSEMDMGGVGLIMVDTAIEFKNEVFYGDGVRVSVAAGDFSSVGFDLYYQLVKEGEVLVAAVKTGMVCYQYGEKRVVRVPEGVRERLLTGVSE